MSEEQNVCQFQSISFDRLLRLFTVVTLPFSMLHMLTGQAPLLISQAVVVSEL